MSIEKNDCRTPGELFGNKTLQMRLNGVEHRRNFGLQTEYDNETAHEQSLTRRRRRRRGEANKNNNNNNSTLN